MKAGPMNHVGMVLLLQPKRQKIGGWVEQIHDAKLHRLGLTWYRVQEGFGGRGDREDWVADVPRIAVSVSRCYNSQSWGSVFDDKVVSFNEAMKLEVAEKLDESKLRKKEHQQIVEDLEVTIRRMSDAVLLSLVKKGKQ